MRTAVDVSKGGTYSTRRRGWLGWAAGLFALALVTSADEAPAASRSLAIIVNPGVPAAAISSGELASIFTRAKRTWKDGSTIRALNLQPGTAERIEFDRAVLDMSPEASAKYWMDKQVRGEEGAPKAVAQAEIVVNLVATMNGAVGYVPEDKADAKVRVVARIRDGKLVAP
jgi:ABC-type phosphate transport system substrate-binding protein